MQGTYIGRGRMLVKTTFGARVLAPADDLVVTPALITEGAYDEPFTNYVRRELSAGMVAIDVGANFGLFSVLMAWQVGPTGRVVAYEPEPRNLEFLKQNLAFNYLDGWVDLRAVAAADAPGRATLHRSDRFWGYHSLMPFETEQLEGHMAFDEVDQLDVALEPLDELVGRFERVALVKVDVEGAEAAVLRGARQLVASGVVRRFSIEVNRPRSGAAWEPFVAELRDLASGGWTFALLDENGTAQATDLQPVLDEGRAAQLLVERL